MATNATPELFVSVLVAGGLLALVKRSLSGPPSLAGLVNVVLRSTTCVGDTQYDVMLIESVASGAAGPIQFEDPLAILLHVATVIAFLHTIDKSCSLVHGNLNVGAVVVVAGTVVISGFEHCCVQPFHSASGSADSPNQPSDGTDWTRLPPGRLSSMAPELVASGIRTTQTDVYAFGILMFRLYAGEYPFARLISTSRYIDAAPVQLGAGKRPTREEIQHKHFTDELWELMDDCWAQKPSDRPTMANVRARLAQIAGDSASLSRVEEGPSVRSESDA